MSVPSLKEFSGHLQEIRDATNLKKWVETSLKFGLRTEFSGKFSARFIDGDPRFGASPEVARTNFKKVAEALINASAGIAY